jgi:hypothetical protein
MTISRSATQPMVYAPTIPWFRRTKTILWTLVVGLFCVMLAFSGRDNTSEARFKLAQWRWVTADVQSVDAFTTGGGVLGGSTKEYALVVNYVTAAGTVQNKCVLGTKPTTDELTIYYDPSDPRGFISPEEEPLAVTPRPVMPKE